MDLIGVNSVIPGCHINFFKFTPKKDSEGNIIGTLVSQVSSIDPKGYIPDFVKTLGIKWLA